MKEKFKNIQTDQNVILALINVSENLKNLVQNINKSLDMSNAQNRLIPQVYVKNIFENCKSALDYMAYLMVKTYNIPIDDRKIYFPIKNSEENFENDKIVSIVKQKNKIIYDILRKVQPFSDDENYIWLNEFNTINNKYKHQGFIPMQAKFCTNNGGFVSLSSGLSLGKFSLVLQDKKTGKSIEYSNDIEKDRGIEFNFCFENNEELIPFLNKIISGVYSLVKEIWINGPKKEDLK